MNHRSSVPRIRLGFEDTGTVTGLHQTHIEGRSWCPRTSLVPECRPNQKRSSACESGRLSYYGGSTRGRPWKWIHDEFIEEKRDRDTGPFNATDSRIHIGHRKHAVAARARSSRYGWSTSARVSAVAGMLRCVRIVPSWSMMQTYIVLACRSMSQ